MKDYGHVSLPRELLEEIDRLMKDLKLGYESRAEFIKEAIRHFMEELKKSSPPKRLEHVNIYYNYVTILDRELEGRGRIVDVMLRKNDEWVQPFCTYCQSENCLHADFAFEVPEIKQAMEKQGLRRKRRPT